MSRNSPGVSVTSPTTVGVSTSAKSRVMAVPSGPCRRIENVPLLFVAGRGRAADAKGDVGPADRDSPEHLRLGDAHEEVAGLERNGIRAARPHRPRDDVKPVRVRGTVGNSSKSSRSNPTLVNVPAVGPAPVGPVRVSKPNRVPLETPT